jgi:hypothetical protein
LIPCGGHNQDARFGGSLYGSLVAQTSAVLPVDTSRNVQQINRIVYSLPDGRQKISRFVLLCSVFDTRDRMVETVRRPWGTLNKNTGNCVSMQGVMTCVTYPFRAALNTATYVGREPFWW